eukprot:3300960-Pyramimonas_sp.AAC.1
MAMDCRVSNPHFWPPPRLDMGTGGAWPRLERPEGAGPLFTAAADVNNYFHTIQNHLDLQLSFCLPPISRGEARTFMGGFEGLSDREPVWPTLRSVPLGWSWAFNYGQKILENPNDEALRGFTQCALLRDVGPIPDVASELGAPPHRDNLNVFGLDKSAAQLAKDRVVSHLRARGFPVHEEVDAA